MVYFPVRLGKDGNMKNFKAHYMLLCLLLDPYSKHVLLGMAEEIGWEKDFTPFLHPFKSLKACFKKNHSVHFSYKQDILIGCACVVQVPNTEISLQQPFKSLELNSNDFNVQNRIPCRLCNMPQWPSSSPVDEALLHTWYLTFLWLSAPIHTDELSLVYVSFCEELRHFHVERT